MQSRAACKEHCAAHARRAADHSHRTKAAFVAVAQARLQERCEIIALKHALIRKRDGEIKRLDHHLACHVRAVQRMQARLVGNKGDGARSANASVGRRFGDATRICRQPAWHIERQHRNAGCVHRLDDCLKRLIQGGSSGIETDAEKAINDEIGRDFLRQHRARARTPFGERMCGIRRQMYRAASENHLDCAAALAQAHSHFKRIAAIIATASEHHYARRVVARATQHFHRMVRRHQASTFHQVFATREGSGFNRADFFTG